MIKTIPKRVEVTCDRCGEIVRGHVQTLLLTDRDDYSGGKHRFDLCSKCLDTFRIYLKSWANPRGTEVQ